MPIYVYRCEKCNKEVEEIKSFSEKDNIPFCDQSSCQMKLKIFAPKLNFVGEDWSSVQTNMRKQYESEKFIDSITK